MPDAESAVTANQKAWAKLNLYLHVVGRRPDGYHLIDSLFIFLDVCDEISIAESDNIELIVDGPYSKALGDPKTNLVMLAATRLAEEAGVSRGARISLTKNLPVASGIGGGSADAAATLRGLRKFWGAEFSDQDLMRIGLELGADVPSCVGSRPASVSGIGEVVDPVSDLPDFAVLLVNPMVGLSTAQVFAGLKNSGAPFSEASSLGVAPADFEQFRTQIEARRNDLEASAIGIAPVIGEVLVEIGAMTDCGLARMSGSGATCFGLFEEFEAARRAADDLRRARPDWWISATEPVRGLG